MPVFPLVAAYIPFGPVSYFYANSAVIWAT